MSVYTDATKIAQLMPPKKPYLKPYNTLALAHFLTIFKASKYTREFGWSTMDKIILAERTPFNPLTLALSIPTNTASSSSGSRSGAGKGPGMGKRTKSRSTLTSMGIDKPWVPVEEAAEKAEKAVVEEVGEVGQVVEEEAALTAGELFKTKSKEIRGTAACSMYVT
jgi:hypothetical protein